MHKMMNIADIIPSPHNPRKPISSEDDEYKLIKSSIERFGYVEPLVVNSVNNHCVGGNNRLTVLKDLGFNEVECVIIDESDEDREIALTIALNRINGRWDYELLENVLNSIGSELLKYTGFSVNELDRFLDSVSSENSDTENIDGDDLPADYDEDGGNDYPSSSAGTTTTAKIGTYSFPITTSDYVSMINDIRITKGFGDDVILAEIIRRLKQK